jgi:hypothetical protein
LGDRTAVMYVWGPPDQRKETWNELWAEMQSASLDDGMITDIDTEEGFSS